MKASPFVVLARLQRAVRNAQTSQEKVVALQRACGVSKAITRLSTDSSGHNQLRLTMSQLFSLAGLLDKFESDRRELVADGFGADLPYIVRSRLLQTMLERMRELHTSAEEGFNSDFTVDQVVVAYCIFLRLVLSTFIRLCMLAADSSKARIKRHRGDADALSHRSPKAYLPQYLRRRQQQLIEGWILAHGLFLEHIQFDDLSLKSISLLCLSLSQVLSFTQKQAAGGGSGLLLLADVEEDTPRRVLTLIDAMVQRLAHDEKAANLMPSSAISLMLSVAKLPSIHNQDALSNISRALIVTPRSIGQKHPHAFEIEAKEYRVTKRDSDAESQIFKALHEVPTASLVQLVRAADRYNLPTRMPLGRLVRTTLLHPDHLVKLSGDDVHVLLHSLVASNSNDDDFVKSSIARFANPKQTKSMSITSLCDLLACFSELHSRSLKRGKLPHALQQAANMIFQEMLTYRWDTVSRKDAVQISECLEKMDISVTGTKQDALQRRVRGMKSLR